MTANAPTKNKPTSKERLIETALDLIPTNSYGAVSVDEMCKAADVRKGSFYHHFKSKSDLAIAAMDALNHSMKPMFDDAFSPSRPPRERFIALAKNGYEKQRESFEKYGQVIGCPVLALGSEMAGQDDGVRAKAEEVSAQCLCYYESALRDLVVAGDLPKDTDISVMALDLQAYVMGHVMMARVKNNIDTLNDNLLRGMFRIMGISEE